MSTESKVIVIDGQGIALWDDLVQNELESGELFFLSELAIEDAGYFLSCSAPSSERSVATETLIGLDSVSKLKSIWHPLRVDCGLNSVNISLRAKDFESTNAPSIYVNQRQLVLISNWLFSHYSTVQGNLEQLVRANQCSFFVPNFHHRNNCH